MERVLTFPPNGTPTVKEGSASTQPAPSPYFIRS